MRDFAPAATHNAAIRRRRVRTWQILTVWLVAVAPLARWGLPSSADDLYLFGGQTPWPAGRYQANAAAEARRTRPGAADTDLNPLQKRDQPVELTASEAARAEILTRYRLYSRQPDEMITFMALQRMNPRALDFDPRLYQYCGGYIYLIGAALGLSSLTGLTTLTGDIDLFLAEPERFARFYLVARAVTLLFAAGLLAAVVRLARLAGGRTAGWIALVLVAACPVFICGALEAKPHLPSVCLQLWAILAALRYLEHRRRSDAVWMGLTAGAAFSLVLTGLAAALLWPALALACGRSGGRCARDLLLAGCVALGVYLLTNPYVPYNALFHRAALASNLANSTAMYRVGDFAAGGRRVAELLCEGVGPTVALAGLAALGWLVWYRPGAAAVTGASGVAMILLGIAIGAGKPAEFARFLLLPGVLLGVGAAVAIAHLARVRGLAGILAFAAAFGLQPALPYLAAFATDAARTHETRRLAAEQLRARAAPEDAIGVVQEPAPYAVPPLDFVHRTVVLLPSAAPRDCSPDDLPPWLVLTADSEPTEPAAWWRRHYQLEARFPPPGQRLTPITWANKAVFVYRRVTPALAPAAPSQDG